MQANQSLPQSICIINFSHPIPDAPSIVRLIPNLSSCFHLEILDIPVQLDLNAPLCPQVESLVDAAVVAANNNIDFIRLPGYAAAAALIVNEFQARGYLPDIIRFARAAGITPPRFEAFEILRFKQSQIVDEDCCTCNQINWSPGPHHQEDCPMWTTKEGA